ncbi:hypothetical protein [Pseudonocardia sp. ICBG1293]|uniref:hypothetical protein n=1 Tax=Pseudonocardia sp. ICBG1293 TaxID=2844382 RepID=UPI001CC8F3F3|nr:hypothetical protein [Pseudonocardia sp. ICBG1293]
MQTKKLARFLATTAFITAIAIGSASGIAAADTPHSASAPAGISQSTAPTFNFNKVNNSEGIVTLKGAKFVTDGIHTSVVDNNGKILEVLPIRITQDGKTATFTYTLNGDHKATVHSSADDNRQVGEYKEWWRCTLGTIGGAVSGGLVGAVAVGSAGSVIPGAGTAAGAVGGGVIGAVGGGATGAAAAC